MTGSPGPRSPLDFFSQFNFLRPGLIGSKNYIAFRAKYAVMEQRIFGGRSVQTVTGYRNLAELTENVKEHSFRVTKEECMDLPPKVYVTRTVELTDEQSKAYVAMREEAFAELEAGSFATATAVITQILRLHQIVCGHITNADGELVRLKSNRVQALLDVCDEIDGKTIVWARYREDIRAIAEALRDVYGDQSVVQYHGGVGMADREYAVNGFQDPSSPVKFFVANQSTGGYGITLTAASNVIYYSNDYDLEKRLQSEDRAHRSGQTKSVLYVDLVSPNTVDDKILESLKNKKSIADLVTGDKVKEWFSR
jgi:SNF2 family DNA or RNA helicase